MFQSIRGVCCADLFALPYPTRSRQSTGNASSVSCGLPESKPYTPKTDTSRPAPGHRVYPYLLRDVEITSPDQVWRTDITYIPMRSGFLYVAAVIDWHSRFVLGWELSNTMETAFVWPRSKRPAAGAKPEIFNSDQGSQFTSDEFTSVLQGRRIGISMDGRGRCLDNVFIERLWRSVKYELVYPGDFADGQQLRTALDEYFAF